jgi:hypothetical protein
VRIDNGGQSLCVDMLAGPDMAFTQSDQWSAEPLAGARQWHGAFASAAPLAAAEFIALLRVGCAPVAALAAKQDGTWIVNLDATRVTIDASASIALQ